MYPETTNKKEVYKTIRLFVERDASGQQQKIFLVVINENKLSRTTHNPIMPAIDPRVINDVRQTPELHRITSSGWRNPIQREIYHFMSSAEKFDKEYWKYQEQSEK